MRLSPRPAAVILLLVLGGFASGQELKTYSTRYYVLHTNLDDHAVQEATLRLTLLAEEYNRRTEDLGGIIRDRLPFYLFSNQKDYVAAGGMPGTAGVFTGDRLMAIANPDYPQATWSVIQHEGFHQFIRARIGTGIPIWANEGMAEYFSAGLWTGDQFMAGFIPPQRLQRIQAGIRQKQFKPLVEMMLLSHAEWNLGLSANNYDQAWSMVHFLAHGDGGKYQQVFGSFLADVARGSQWEPAWRRRFGEDVRAFQQRWEAYWLGQPEEPTRDLYAEAFTSTLTSFYARATMQKQKFETAEAFLAAAKAGDLQMPADDWLPPKLLEAAVAVAPQLGTWDLVKRGGPLTLTCTLDDGTVLTGRFQIQGRKVKKVWVDVRPGKPVKKGKGRGGS